VPLRAQRRPITTGHRTTSRGDITRDILSPLLPPRRHRGYPRLTKATTSLRRDPLTRRHGPATITMDADP
jgi:hypothetical protein